MVDMKNTKVILIITLASIALNVWLLIVVHSEDKPQQINNAEEKTKYPYLATRILGEYDRDLLIHFSPIRRDLRELVEGKYGNDFALYFEYLATGTSIGINDRTEFFPGSLLKVPTIMAYLRRKEVEERRGDPLFTIEAKDLDRRFGNLWRRGAGAKIRESEAIRLALTESDNTAANIIHRNAREEDFDYVYEGLDVSLTFSSRENASITPKEYASILKALYFASILSRENSHYILDLLAQTPFNNKLDGGVPENIKVAHKIGLYESAQIPIYSDCGIVYFPRRNYVLCMASRSDEATAIERMKTVSQMVYEYVSTVNPTGEEVK